MVNKFLTLFVFVYIVNSQQLFGNYKVFNDDTFEPLKIKYKEATKKRQDVYDDWLVATPSEINPDGDTVTLRWWGIPYMEGDYIGIWCPPYTLLDETEVSLGQPLEARVVHPNTTSMVIHNLIGMRCDYQFKYIEADGPSYMPNAVHSVMATSNLVSVRGGSTFPAQIHIAITNQMDEMIVSFVTSGSSSDILLRSIVEYSVNEDMSNSVVVTGHDIVTYSASDMCGRPANLPIQPFFRDPGMIHHVTLKNLKPATRYFYRVRASVGNFSEIYSFTTRGSEKNVTIAYFGDMGVDVFPMASGTIYRCLQDPDLDLVIHPGDLGYAMGFGWVWEYFFKVIQPLATRVPYMISVGNHEYDYVSMQQSTFRPQWGNYGDDSGGECGVPMRNRFRMPDNGNYWYSFNYGNIHIIMLSTEHNFTMDSEQYNWLISDLESVDRSETPFVILTGHRPMYSSYPDVGEQAVATNLRVNLEPLLIEYHVQLCLWAHMHLYERTCTVYDSECVQSGSAPMHVTVGTAGTFLDSGVVFNLTWSVANLMGYWGYLRLQSTDKYIQGQFILNNNGSVFDEFYVKAW